MSKKFIFGQENRLANVDAIFLIMAGGSGTRFWPLSRQDKPKQYLPLAPGGQTLIQSTAERAKLLKQNIQIVVSTGFSQLDLVKSELPNSFVICEPEPKNTGACIGLSSLVILEQFGDKPVIALPADHLIFNNKSFSSSLEFAIKIATQDDMLVTIGIKPERAETGYGYIEKGKLLSGSNPQQICYMVNKFIEKPGQEIADQFFKGGNHFWNSGIFIFKPSVMLNAISKFMPGLNRVLLDLRAMIETGEYTEDFISSFSSLDAISIDYGVMEKADNVILIPGEEFQWSDIGSWDSWGETQSELLDENQNLIIGDKQGILVDTTKSIICNYSKNDSANSKLLALVGLENIVVVETDDSILICPKSRSQDVKKVVEELKQNKKHLL